MVDHRQSVLGSMLWAAYGDALGFITELANTGLIKARIGSARVTELVPWQRRIGGRQGVPIELPRGTYSDDTQLRLATCRAIRGDGFFDVEAFAKVELPVWMSYGLGGGRGTKAAARSLTKSSVSWATNFFDTKQGKYINGGGNGVAMRIQPHVWANPLDAPYERVLVDVMRNGVVTHGHSRALVGAAFHALCLRATMKAGTPPGPEQWRFIFEKLRDLAGIVAGDDHLATFWKPFWENTCGVTLDQAVKTVIGECEADTAAIRYEPPHRDEVYRSTARAIGAYERASVGSGTKTALLAALAAWLYRDDPHAGMLCVANEPGTDTDTIATMYGAIVGAVTTALPSGVADEPCLRAEAERLAAIATGRPAGSFGYPDLFSWTPPASQMDVLGSADTGLVVAGLGPVVAIGEPVLQPGTTPAMWQWVRLHTGQSMLIKRRPELRATPRGQLSVVEPAGAQPERQQPVQGAQGELFSAVPAASLPRNGESPDAKAVSMTIDEAYDAVHRANFDTVVIGRTLLMLSEQEGGVDRAVAFAAIVAKAINARVAKLRGAKPASHEHKPLHGPDQRGAKAH